VRKLRVQNSRLITGYGREMPAYSASYAWVMRRLSLAVLMFVERIFRKSVESFM
jgi:hypothetical protein